jgi:hypothetical protein
MDESLAECRTCREPIRPGARKCTKCDSFQDWRRFLTLSTSALALVIALISVTSALGPGIVRLFAGERSALTVSYIAPVDGGILLLASNPGTRPAVVHGVSLVSRPDFIDFEIKPAGTTLVINPGQTQAITVALKVTALPEGAYAAFVKEETHSIYVHTTQFAGRKDTVELRIPQTDLFRPVLEGRDFILFEQGLTSDFVRDNPHMLDRLDPKAIERISPAVLDQLSPEIISRLKKAHAANQPRTLMQR